MKAMSIVVWLVMASVGCATAVEDPRASFSDAGHGRIDTGAPLTDDGVIDSASAVDDSGGRFDASTSLDTGRGGFDGGTGVDDSSVGGDDSTVVVGLDTGGVPDFGPPPPDASPPPPTDAGGSGVACAVDKDCPPPYNCCQPLSMTCGLFFGAFCFPLP
jgi:hypothetical protein